MPYGGNELPWRRSALSEYFSSCIFDPLTVADDIWGFGKLTSLSSSVEIPRKILAEFAFCANKKWYFVQ